MEKAVIETKPLQAINYAIVGVFFTFVHEALRLSARIKYLLREIYECQ